jgi:hypothetical protein
MRYRFSRVFEFVILCLLFLSSASAQTLVRVNEHAARIQFLSEDTVVDLPVENPSRDTISAHLLLELVDPAGARPELSGWSCRGFRSIACHLPPPQWQVSHFPVLGRSRGIS